MALTNERIEEGFKQEYDALIRNGAESILAATTLGEALWDIYRRGYVRGHSDRSREVHQEARSAANLPLTVTYADDRLYIGGKEIAKDSEHAGR